MVYLSTCLCCFQLLLFSVYLQSSEYRSFIFLGRLIPKNFVFFFFRVFRAVPMAYGGSQARGLTGAVAAGLCHSHSNAGSEPQLRPPPQLMAMLDP